MDLPLQGPIIAQVEVFELITGTNMVEVTRFQGDHMEFYKIYHQLVERGTVIVGGKTCDKTATFEPLPVRGKSVSGPNPDLKSSSGGPSRVISTKR